jgi:hypothetical protein
MLVCLPESTDGRTKSASADSLSLTAFRIALTIGLPSASIVIRGGGGRSMPVVSLITQRISRRFPGTPS